MTTYGVGSTWSEPQRAQAVAELTRQIDFHSNGVSFRTELRELSRRPEAGRYLAELEAGLRRAAAGEGLQLFALTERYAGSPAEAMRWLAVLVQDVRLRTATDDYFEGEVPDELLPRFRSIMALLQTPAVMSNVTPYPPGVVSRDISFYHYYVPAHLARRLQDAGVPAKLAAASATIFNAEYELNQHVARQGDTLDRLSFIQDGVADGLDMDPRSIEQIRLGYVGAMRATGLEPDPRAFSRAQLESPREAFRQLMR